MHRTKHHTAAFFVWVFHRGAQTLYRSVMKHPKQTEIELSCDPDTGGITQLQLKDALFYNEETGQFVWRVKRRRTSPGDIAGATDDKGYRTIGIRGRIYKAHRLAWLYVYGKWPSHFVDHIDGNPGNNRISNLRDVPQTINMKNARIYKNNTSGIPGVSWSSRRSAWVSSIKIAGYRRTLGYSASFLEACCMRKSAEIGRGFHPNHGR